MKTIELTIYNFKELSEEAQKTAVENDRHINVEGLEWWDFEYTNFKEKYGNVFNITNIYFSGFWSQGDGAMFEYDQVNTELLKEAIEKVVKEPKYKKEALKKGVHLSGGGQHSGHYYHENTCSHKFYMEMNDPDHGNLDELLTRYYEQIEGFIIAAYKEMCRELYKSLESTYDGLTSDEAVKESLIANEYDFLGDGKRYF